MQFAKISKALAGVAVLALFSAAASADVYNKKTTLTVNETVEIPGATLEPGEYVVQLVDSQANRHIVRFMNKEEDEVLSTVIAIPNTRLEPTEDTAFAWYETPAGQPPALRAWFYPGDTFGQEFAYPEGRATELSAAMNQEVPSISDEESETIARQETVVIAQTPAQTTDPQATEQQTAQQDREREMAAQRERELQAQQEERDREAAQREREMAAQRERDAQAQRDREREIAQAQEQQRTADQNLTAQQQRPQTEQTTTELPQTAGLGALLALIGLGSLGASRAVRKLRNK